MYSIREFSAYSRFKVTLVKLRPFRVTSGHLRSSDVSCHVIAFYCELQPSRN